MRPQTIETADEPLVIDEKHAALSYLSDAFAEASLDGIDVNCMAQAALFLALKEMVTSFGEEPVATFAQGLSQRILKGEFTLAPHRQ